MALVPVFVASARDRALRSRAEGQEALISEARRATWSCLSASVTDKDGGFVEGVDRERFAIYDEGKRQAIALFSNEDTPVSVGSDHRQQRQHAAQDR